MAIRPVVVCDVCGADKAADHYQIVLADGTRWDVDLCAKDGAALEAYRKDGVGRLARSGGRRRTFSATTIEEVRGRASKRS